MVTRRREIDVERTDSRIKNKEDVEPNARPDAIHIFHLALYFISKPNVGGIDQINARVIKSVGSLLGVCGFAPIVIRIGREGIWESQRRRTWNK
jgi:hypothetical protein